MKIRSGFVSNSSSSSFIIGYGVVKDKDKFDKYCKTHDITVNTKNEDHTDYCKSVYLYEDPYEIYDHKFSESGRILTGGNITELLVPQTVIPYNDPIVTVEINNDEGDGPPFVYEEGKGDGQGGFNYEVAKKISFYSDVQQAIINLFKEETGVLINCKVLFGAERNG
jgi:hypothetical protein